MKLQVVPHTFMNIFLVIIGISCISASVEIDSTQSTTYSDSNLISQDAQSNVIRAKQAQCEPEPQVVQVKENPSPSKIYFPSCVRINRCGGCCASELMSCQPTATETNNYQIQVSKLVGGKFVVSSELVPLEKHTKCKCKCKIQEQDCNVKQIYRKEDCRCICRNFDEMNNCQTRNGLKFWNAENCSCDCRKIQECSTGNVFDTKSCSCVREG